MAVETSALIECFCGNVVKLDESCHWKQTCVNILHNIPSFTTTTTTINTTAGTATTTNTNITSNILLPIGNSFSIYLQVNFSNNYKKLICIQITSYII